MLGNLSFRTFSSAASEIRRVGVVGLGLMGHGIAQTAASKGFEVVGVESSAASLAKGQSMIQQSLDSVGKSLVKKGKLTEEAAAEQSAATMSRLTFSDSLSAVQDCDIVVEAIIEDLAIKQDFYAKLGDICDPKTLFASNTSSFRISLLADPSGRPEKMVGLHFFNPVQIMKLVEVIRCDQTSPDAYEAALQFGRDLGKEVVQCKDTPGFVVNRLLVPYMAQALLMLDRGEASVPDIDTAMKFGAGHPMGPLTLVDYVGLDTCLSILEGWVRDYPDEPAFVIPEVLRAKVAAGHFGRKSGTGFYKWEGSRPVGVAE